ncbi:sensor histidine kinase [Pleionea sediminis]|uniref:sensor histidine kinase n=1 Tax=Pleionea sediminis TaxID=2569479 RepID=UPI0013DDB74F|nr:ATP-binding protein [Pleionea sediminis]
MSRQLSESLTEEKYIQLRQDLRFINRSLEKEIQQLRTDAQIIARSRIIKGLIESTNSSSSNILDVIEEEEWKESLTVLFNQTLAASPPYFKVRLIKYKKDKQSESAIEKITAWKRNNKITLLPPDKLQEKIHRPYIKNSTSLSPDEVLLSKLSLDREEGKIYTPTIATLRSVAPIFDREILYGFIVISMDITHTFEDAAEILTQDINLYATQDDGQFIYHPEKEKTFTFEFPEKAQHIMENEFYGSDKIFNDNKLQYGTVRDKANEEYSLVHEKFHFDPLNPDRYIRISLIQPYSKIESITDQLNRSLIYTSLIIVTIAIILTTLALRALAIPIQQLLASIKKFGRTQKIDTLPTERNDELGTLAQQFRLMSTRVIEQTNLLNQEVLIRRLTDKQLRAREEELKRSNEELEKFAYVASHDLQEPLRKVQAFGDRLIARSYDDLDDKSKDYLKRMQQAASRMSQLISDLLSFSRVATRGRPFQSTNMNEIVNGVISDLEIAIEQSGAIVEVNDLPVVEGDELQLRQLMQNLIGNSLKFRRADVQHHVKIWSKVNDDDTQIEIHIQDNGIGMDSKYSERIFEVFQRLHARNEYEGTGIGLAICKKIVERHNGKIEVKSTLGEGSEFIVFLPLN